MTTTSKVPNVGLNPGTNPLKGLLTLWPVTLDGLYPA